MTRSGGGAPRPGPTAPAAWEYRGRWALVTGASSGLGREFARALAARGMDVVLAARSRDRLAELARHLEAEHGVRTAVVPADLARPGAAGRLWAEAGDGRAIHLLVNCAGFGLRGAFHALDAARQAEMVAVNCTAVMELAHAALGGMRARGEGGVVNVASIVAFQPVPTMAVYGATKAFVLSLSRALAEECRGSGVRVLALCPGPTPSGFQAVAGTRVRDGQPGAMSAAEVVRAGLAGLEAGRAQVVPGAANRAATALGRLLPLGIATRAAGWLRRRES